MKSRYVIEVASCIALAACSSTPPIVATDSPTRAPVAATSPSPAPATVPVRSTSVTGVETSEQRLARVTKALTSNSIYFDYDDYSIKQQYQDILKQNADLLLSVPELSVVLTGNADERGSSEYNLALGQKRADAVKRAIKMVGVPEPRLEAVSYGKEKPRATCHEEKCWAENRRVDFSSGKDTPRK